MKMAKYALGSFAFVAFMVFALSIVSAATLDINLVSVPANIDHDSGSFNIDFTLVNTGAADSSVSFSLDLISGSATLERRNVAISQGTSTDPETLPLTAVINFGPNQAGPISGDLIADDSGGGAEKRLPFSVNINNALALSVEKTQTLTLVQPGKIRVKNEGNTLLNNIVLTDTGAFDVTFNPSSVASLIPGATSSEITVSAVSPLNLKFGDNNVVMTARSGATQTTSTFSIRNTFCKNGDVGGKLELSKVKIDNQDGDDDTWELLDVVEVEVKVENNNPDDLDVDDVIVELGLFDSNGKNVVDDLDWLGDADEEEVEIGDINEGDDDTVTFRFRVPADFEDGSHKLAVKAYGDKAKEEIECIGTSSDLSNEFYDKISIDRIKDEEKSIVVDDFFLPAEVTCGEVVPVSATVFNIGNDDQDQVLVTMFSQKLGISNQEFTIREDLDSGDDQRINFEFVVPEVNDGLFTLSFETFSDYRSRDGTYRTSSEDAFTTQLRVVGCKGTGSGGTSTGSGIVSISARLDSDAKPGEKLVVVSTIKNIGISGRTFAVDASGFSSWSSLDSLSERIVTLEAGESKDVVFSFTVDEDASGSNSFFIEATSEGQTQRREVSVTIEDGSDGLGGGIDFGGNNLVWVIAIINIILIILIIVVAVRISRG